MRTLLIPLMLLMLIGGAIINVAVAWVALLRLPDSWGQVTETQEMLPYLVEAGIDHVCEWARFVGDNRCVYAIHAAGATQMRYVFRILMRIHRLFGWLS